MFGSLGFPEILFILVLALLVFGPKKLPEVGRTIGKALGEFRRATGDLKRSFDQEINSEPSSAPSSRPSSTPPVARSKAEDADSDREEPEVSEDPVGDADEVPGSNE